MGVKQMPLTTLFLATPTTKSKFSRKAASGNFETTS
jgi:hypothetical protein